MPIDTTWLAESADAEEAAALTTRLVAHRSYPGEEANVQAAVADWFRVQGLKAVLEPTEQADRPNVVVRVDNGPGPVLLLNGHVDTVLDVDGWQSDPWQARRDGDLLYGLGACDM